MGKVSSTTLILLSLSHALIPSPVDHGLIGAILSSKTGLRLYSTQEEYLKNRFKVLHVRLGQAWNTQGLVSLIKRVWNLPKQSEIQMFFPYEPPRILPVNTTRQLKYALSSLQARMACPEYSCHGVLKREACLQVQVLLPAQHSFPLPLQPPAQQSSDTIGHLASPQTSATQPIPALLGSREGLDLGVFPVFLVPGSGEPLYGSKEEYKKHAQQWLNLTLASKWNPNCLLRIVKDAWRLPGEVAAHLFVLRDPSSEYRWLYFSTCRLSFTFRRQLAP